MIYYKEYMISVCAILILSSAASEILVDFSWSKYINIICGILFAVCLFNPVMSIFDKEIKIDYQEDDVQSAKNYIEDNVEKEFSSALTSEIIRDVQSAFDTTVSLKAVLKDKSRIEIYFFSPAKDDIYVYIKKKYNPDKIHIVGG